MMALQALAENELSDRVFCDKASTFDGITNETQLMWLVCVCVCVCVCRGGGGSEGFRNPLSKI